MEDINNELDTNYLLKLLNHEDLTREFHNEIKVSLYLTLLSLYNNNYQENIYNNEINIIEDYLRKINNLKVKIQLKRKPEEIDNLLNEIKELTINNETIIKKYNKENVDIISVLDTKDPKEITPLIDKLTKVKINKQEKKTYYDNLRKHIIDNIYINNNYIEDNTLYIGNDIAISLDDFYEVFDYLLTKDNYKNVYLNNETNISRDNIINNIIDSINNNAFLNDEVIPVVLTTLLINEVSNYEEIDMSKFNIDNIKITDLYSFAGTNNELNNDKLAKWRKVSIPNSYLYQKIKELVNKGMYYFKDNKFILENINNGISDFKISINISDMYEFLKDSINNINEVKTKSKHI